MTLPGGEATPTHILSQIPGEPSTVQGQRGRGAETGPGLVLDVFQDVGRTVGGSSPDASASSGHAEQRHLASRHLASCCRGDKTASPPARPDWMMRLFAA